MGNLNENIINSVFLGSRRNIAAKIILVAILLLVLMLVSCKTSESGSKDTPGNNSVSSSENVSVSGNKQSIEVIASGGYFPEEVNAKAGIKSILIIKSENAYGCERALRIPALGINTSLPINGITEIELGSQEKGTTLLGTCSMGMYTFEIIFN